MRAAINGHLGLKVNEYLTPGQAGAPPFDMAAPQGGRREAAVEGRTAWLSLGMEQLSGQLALSKMALRLA